MQIIASFCSRTDLSTFEKLHNAGVTDVRIQRLLTAKAHKVLSYFYEGLTFDIDDITFDTLTRTITLDVPLKNQKLGRSLLEWAIKEAK